MIDKEQLKELIAKIEYHKNEIGKHRDQLRDIVSDIEAITETVEDARWNLSSAVDELSKYL